MSESLFGIIVLLSFICQIAAAAVGLRIAKISRPGWGWLLLAGGMVLMAIRQGVVLAAWWRGFSGDFSQETIALFVSIACLLGVLLIKPVLDASWRFQTFMEMETERLNAILQLLPGMVYRCRNDPQWTMEFVSDGCRELTGYTPEDLIGNRRIAYGEVIIPEDRDAVYREVEAAVANKRPYRLVYRIRTAQGQVKWVWEQGAGVFDEEGEVLYLTGYITDVTVWRNIEEELRKAQATWAQEKEEWVKQEGQLLSRVWYTFEHQNQTIAYEIHDGCVQLATAALMNLESYRHQRATSPETAEQLLERAIQLLRDSIAEARRLIQGLRPVALEEQGLIPALQMLFKDWEKRTNVQIHFVNRTDIARLVPPVEVNVYRIIQEAVQNAIRHSQSPEVFVQLAKEGDQLVIEVRDEGVGFDVKSVPRERFGLTSIRDRARLLGGWADIVSEFGRGTLVRVVIPLNPLVSAPTNNGSQPLGPVPVNS
ncbi:MAG: PAS domain-containing protein [Thermogutta sp.]